MNRELAWRLARACLPPVAVVLAIFLGWEVATCGPDAFNPEACIEDGGMRQFLYSSPSLIWHRIQAGQIAMDDLLSKSWITFYRSALALLIAAAAALAWFWFAARYEWVKNGGLAVATVLQVIPFVSFMWLFHALLAPYDKLAFGVVVAIFPLVGTLLVSLGEVPKDGKEVLDVYGAKHQHRVQLVLYPAAVSGFFGGLLLAAPLAVIGVLIADLGGGTDTGLGSGIFSFARQSDAGKLWAYTFAAIGVSGLLWASVRAGELVFMRKNQWYERSGTI